MRSALFLIWAASLLAAERGAATALAGMDPMGELMGAGSVKIAVLGGVLVVSRVLLLFVALPGFAALVTGRILRVREGRADASRAR